MANNNRKHRSGNPAKNRKANQTAAIHRVHKLSADDAAPPLKVDFEGVIYEIPGTPTPGMLNAITELSTDINDVDAEDLNSTDALTLFGAFFNYQLSEELADKLRNQDMSILSRLFKLWQKHMELVGASLGE